jgi:hypothetical protein
MIVLCNGSNSLTFESSLELYQYTLENNIVGYYVAKVNSIPDSTLTGVETTFLQIKVLGRTTKYDLVEYCKLFVSLGDRIASIYQNPKKSKPNFEVIQDQVLIEMPFDDINADNPIVESPNTNALDKAIGINMRQLGFGNLSKTSKKKSHQRAKARK